MVKVFMKNCELKCEKIVVKFVVKCVEFKVIIKNLNISDDECWDVQMKLQQFFCDVSFLCFWNCCQVIGCFYGVLCKFELLWIKFCEYGMCGDVLGLIKVSW